MNDIDLIVNQLSRDISHQDLTVEPSYYNDLKEIFAEKDLPGLLRHEIIKKNDRSIPLFLTVVKEYCKSLNDKLVAVLCSGSGLLSQEIYAEYFSDRFEIHHFDKSKIMLHNSLFASQKYCVDLSKPLNLEQKYDLVLAQGCLRYFSNCLPELGDNINSIVSKTGYFILGETDLNLVSKLSQILKKYHFEVKLKSQRTRVFRKTLFYSLMLKYQKDLVFKNLVLSQINSDKKVEEVLIELAGFKEIDYGYCIAGHQL